MKKTHKQNIINNAVSLTYTLHGAIDGESFRTAGETPPSVWVQALLTFCAKVSAKTRLTVFYFTFWNEETQKKWYNYFIKSSFKLLTSGPPSGDLLLRLLQFLIQKVVHSRMSRLSNGFLTRLSHYNLWSNIQTASNWGQLWILAEWKLETESISPLITPLLLSSLSYSDKQGIQFLNIHLSLFLWRCKT